MDPLSGLPAYAYGFVRMLTESYTGGGGGLGVPPGVARVWHVALYLAPQALAGGIGQSSFMLRSSLGSARRELGDTIVPRSLGGEGSACCGQMTNYVATVPSSLLSLRVRLNVSAGSVRAVYLKAGSAALFPDDISGQQCDRLTPLCHMSWYMSYDRYTGTKQYASANTTTVPAGGASPDKRTAGEWYVSVQDAGVAPITEYTLSIDAVTLSTDADERACDRFGRFDCSNDLWKVPPDLYHPTVELGDDGYPTESSAARRTGGGGGGGGRALSAMLPTAAIATACAALLALGAPRRRRRSRSS